jgi:hypothetical protein
MNMGEETSAISRQLSVKTKHAVGCWLLAKTKNAPLAPDSIQAQKSPGSLPERFWSSDI